MAHDGGRVECEILERTRVYEIMSSPPVTIEEDADIEAAARRMYEAGVGSVVVVDGEGRLAGIITRRDLIYLLAVGAARRNPPVRMYMTTSVITIGENETARAALERMSEARVRHLVVVDEQGRPHGVVSLWDILTLLSQNCLEPLA